MTVKKHKRREGSGGDEDEDIVKYGDDEECVWADEETLFLNSIIQILINKIISFNCYCHKISFWPFLIINYPVTIKFHQTKVMMMAWEMGW